MEKINSETEKKESGILKQALELSLRPINNINDGIHKFIKEAL